MASSSQLSAAAIIAFAVVLVGFMGSSSAQLSTDFYFKSCPNVFFTVKSVVQSALSQESRLGASLLRLHFHDCFVNGCDGSILLDDTSPSQLGEKTAGPNNRSVRGFRVVDDIKSQVEKVCPGVVSCADILAISARDSVVILGGPSWDVKLGRRDAKTASFFDANAFLPSPNSTLDTLISKFSQKGLSTTDMVALSGAHTIGESRCLVFRDRIYKDTTTIDTSFAQMRQDQCPLTTGGRKNRAPLDLQTPTTFDNKYFKNLINKKGLFRSDQALYNGGSTDSLVKTYSNNAQTFNDDFAAAMIKMGDIEPLTGSSGEIRKNCRKAN